MKFLLQIAAVAFVAASFEAKILNLRKGLPPAGPADQRSTRAPQWGLVTQRVDNFNQSDSRTWNMWYLKNDQFFKPGGPMFVFIGGEWAITADYLTTGQMFDMAAEHNGYMFYAEHRYYGESYPTPDLTTANLRYLSSEQALADLANFIRVQKSNVAGLETSKVVVIGGSYAGSLATWAKLKYPDLISAAYASSAPLKAVADFDEYFEVVDDNVRIVDAECARLIRDGAREAKEMLGKPDGARNVSETYNTCKPINVNQPYSAYFFNSIGNVFAGLIQYARPGDVAAVCNYMKAWPGTAVEKVAHYVRWRYGGACMSDYDDFVNYYKQTFLGVDDFRLWFYQTCTEFGFYQTSASKKDMFGKTFGTDLFTRMCTDVYGPGINEKTLKRAIRDTNKRYGALKPKVTEVVQVHGSVDPWYAIGQTKDLNGNAPSIFVTGTAHCADLSSANPAYDNEEMLSAKTRVKELIRMWIK